MFRFRKKILVALIIFSISLQWIGIFYPRFVEAQTFDPHAAVNAAKAYAVAQSGNAAILTALGTPPGAFHDPRAFSAILSTAYATVQANVQHGLDKIEQGFTDSLLVGGMFALANGLEFFTKKMAYEVATLIGSGATGQKSLFQTESVGDVLKNTALDSAASTISELARPFGLGLCGIPDISIRLNLQIGLRNLYGAAPQPSCSWQKFRDGWDPNKFAAKYGGNVGPYLADKFSATLSVKNSDFGIALSGLEAVDNSVSSQVVTDLMNELRNQGGVKEVTDLISGNVKTPSALVKEDMAILSATHQERNVVSETAAAFQGRLPEILTIAGSTFLNTLASQLLNKILNPNQGLSAPGAFDSSFFGFGTTASRQEIQKSFSDIVTARDYKYSAVDYSIVEHFASCPENPQLDNCVIDQNFQLAIERSTANNGVQPLTIREAMDSALLNPNWKLIPPSDAVHNTDKKCATYAFCYSNIQKLRKARIVPIGFEIAAQSADPDKEPTLADVVGNFDSCNPTDPNFKYCHLINPNWLIKSPPARCDTTATGPELIAPNGATRRSECMDLSTLLNSTSDPTPTYGYCTQEKNVWKLSSVDSCQPQNNTCKTYQGPVGEVSYLSRTVEYAECAADTVGCRAYATERDASGNWVTSAGPAVPFKNFGRNQILYFNDNIKSTSCSESANGCTSFSPAKFNGDGTYQKDANASLVHLKKAPDYLGCYDTTFGTSAFTSPHAVQWPTTLADIQNKVSRNAACEKFAPVCTADEVGCESYTPVRTSGSATAIPGIVGANTCAKECVGYDTFKQQKSAFDLEVPQTYFIPANAKACTGNSGCDEFTNLEARTSGGEAREYYTDLKYCEKPGTNADGKPNKKTFYSWEGSETTGYTLRVYELLQIDSSKTAQLRALNLSLQSNAWNPAPVASRTVAHTIDEVFPSGSPAYDDSTSANLNGYYARCNAESYANAIHFPADISGLHPAEERANPDCRALYDDAGNVYYRLLAHTVTVSDACHTLRKTVTVFDPSAAIANSNQSDCSARGGHLDGTTCKRCIDGGKYVEAVAGVSGGYCLYQTISAPGESESCPASANLCRTYIGNTGNNREQVTNDTFEPASSDAQALRAANQWWDIPANDIPNRVARGIATSTDIGVVSESLQIGGHSLGVNANAVSRHLSSPSIAYGNTYELTFWARGVSPQNLKIAFDQDGLSNQPSFADALSIGTAWQQYHLGPIQFIGKNPVSGDALSGYVVTPTRLTFTRSAQTGIQTSRYFLDHIQLVALQDHADLVKDSWKTSEGYQVPLTCNSHPNDGLPGEALGCMEYKDSNNASVYAAGFQSLCRAKAVGCSPLYETHSDVGGATDFPSAFHLWCALPQGATAQPVSCTISVVIAEDSSQSKEYSCNALRGSDGCFIAEKVVLPKNMTIAQDGKISGVPRAVVKSSTVIVPPDAPRDRPVFLSNQKQYQCAERDVGCMEAGIEKKILPRTDSAAYSTEPGPTYILNRPSAYLGPNGAAGTLCSSESVGCQKFSFGGGESYFKDPTVTGVGTCSYNTVGGSTGWFHDGLGKCAGGQTIGQLCATDAQCYPPRTLSSAVARGACANIGGVACYADFIRRTANGVIYDIHSNKDGNAYAGYVGVCPASENMCTELLDPANTSTIAPRGAAYYVKANNILKNKEAECNGKVTLTGGCVLFNQTENPSRSWRADATYLASERGTPPFAPVDPVSAPDTAQNDANLIVKVDRDRACGQWLSCKSSVTDYVNNPTGAPTTLCSSFAPCDQIGPSGTCDHWVDSVSQPFSILTPSVYAGRPVSWNDPDYSGYSLVNQYQVGEMSYVSFDLGSLSTPDTRTLANNLSKTQYLVHHLRDISCADNWTACGQNDVGRCYSGQCLAPVDYSRAGIPSSLKQNAPVNATNKITISDVSKILGYFTGGACKAFPESDSPFSEKVAGSLDSQSSGVVNFPALPPGKTSQPVGVVSRKQFTERKPLFANANICQNGDCSCEYKTISYAGGQKDFYLANTPLSQIPTGVCSGSVGSNGASGLPCRVDVDCGAQGSGSTCNQISSRETHIGVSGFCLEPDLSRPVNGLARVGESQDHACLTWLPIQTSASAIDFLNLDPRAGYYPDADARTSEKSQAYGQVYCANATQVGGRVNGANTVWEGKEYFGNGGGSPGKRTAFFSDGTCIGDNCPLLPYGVPNINRIQTSRFLSCWDAGSFNDVNYDIPYLRLVCGNGLPVTYTNAGYCERSTLTPCTSNNNCGANDRCIIVSSNFGGLYNNIRTETQPIILAPNYNYEAMQEWSWKMLGNNTLVLRTEIASNSSLKDRNGDFPGVLSGGESYLGLVDDPTRGGGCGLGRGVNNHCWDIQYLIPFPDGRNDNASWRSFGTVIHPPRLWIPKPQSQSVEQTQYNYLPQLTYKQLPDQANTTPRWLRAPAYSPGDEYIGAVNPDFSGIIRGGEFGTPSVIRAPAEGFIHESDLKKVFFVPMAFPFGAQGINPDPLTRQMYIDFAELDRSPNGAGAPRTFDESFFESGYDDNGLRNAPFSEALVLTRTVSNNNAQGVFLPNLWSTTVLLGDSVLLIPNEYNSQKPGDRRQKATGDVWTYKLSRTSDAKNKHGLISFDTYPLDGQDRTNIQPFVNMGRNEIASRYVMVYFNKWDRRNRTMQIDSQKGYQARFPSFIPVSVTGHAELPNQPPDRGGAGGNDPFTATCDASADNWFAIGMDFNKDGEFLGYITRWCNATFEDRDPANNGDHIFDGTETRFRGNAIMMTTVATLNDECTQFAKVYTEDNPTGQTNKAWTDRVWANAMDSIDDKGNGLERTHLLYDPATRAFLRVMANRPFGSLPLQSSSVNTVTTPAVAPADLRNATFRYGTEDNYVPASGVPAKCVDGTWNGFSILDQGNMSCSPPDQSFVDRPFSAYPDPLIQAINRYNRVTNTGATAINELFARIFTFNVIQPRVPDDSFIPNIWTLGDPAKFNDISGNGANSDNGRTLLAPQIYSINPVRCDEKNHDPNYPCSVAEKDSFTISGRNFSHNVYDQSGIPFEESAGAIKPIISVGSFSAKMQFFAFADDNRMPIRRVTINWGDDSVQPPAKIGFFKNRKPFCQKDDGYVAEVGLCGTNPSTLSSVTCQQDTDCQKDGGTYACYGPTGAQPTGLFSKWTPSDSYKTARFGNAVRACTQKPFTFDYNYTCPSDLDRRFPDHRNLPPWVKEVQQFDSRNGEPPKVLKPRQGDSVDDTISTRDTGKKAYTQLRASGLIDTSLVCVYRPRVQLVDNWGWCRGGGVALTGDIPPDVYSNRHDDEFNQGNYCSPSDPAQKPWIYYHGYIIVVPPIPGG